YLAGENRNLGAALDSSTMSNPEFAYRRPEQPADSQPDVSASEAPTWETLAAVIDKHIPGMDTTVVRRAYDFAAEQHAGVWRQSGEPYISHPNAVAMILAEM